MAVETTFVVRSLMTKAQAVAGQLAGAAVLKIVVDEETGEIRQHAE